MAIFVELPDGLAGEQELRIQTVRCLRLMWPLWLQAERAFADLPRKEYSPMLLVLREMFLDVFPFLSRKEKPVSLADLAFISSVFTALDLQQIIAQLLIDGLWGVIEAPLVGFQGGRFLPVLLDTRLRDNENGWTDCLKKCLESMQVALTRLGALKRQCLWGQSLVTNNAASTCYHVSTLLGIADAGLIVTKTALEASGLAPAQQERYCSLIEVREQTFYRKYSAYILYPYADMLLKLFAYSTTLIALVQSQSTSQSGCLEQQTRTLIDHIGLLIQFHQFIVSQSCTEMERNL